MQSMYKHYLILQECSGGVNEDRANPVLEAELAGQRGDESLGEVRISKRLTLHFSSIGPDYN